MAILQLLFQCIVSLLETGNSLFYRSDSLGCSRLVVDCGEFALGLTNLLLQSDERILGLIGSSLDGVVVLVEDRLAVLIHLTRAEVGIDAVVLLLIASNDVLVLVHPGVGDVLSHSKVIVLYQLANLHVDSSLLGFKARSKNTLDSLRLGLAPILNLSFGIYSILPCMCTFSPFSQIIYLTLYVVQTDVEILIMLHEE